MSLALERLEELRVADLPRATIDNLPAATRVRIAGDRRDEVARYLRGFVAAPGCPCCDSWATFTWGIVHGQGKCSSCGWPGVAYHFVGEGEAQLRLEAFLWAHPSEVESR